jgi:hypothetical protein
MSHVVCHRKIHQIAYLVFGARASFNDVGCYSVECHGLLEVCLLGTKILHALKLMSQAHIVQNNSGRAVVARDGENSRQLGVIDNQGLIEGRKCVVDRDSPKGTLRTQRKVEVTLCARATHYDLLSWLLRGDLVSSQHRGAQLFLFEHRKSTTFTLDVVFVHLSTGFQGWR